ncbi:cobalamin B12-binding domain-containing protein [Clostridium sp. DL1XJH146]
MNSDKKILYGEVVSYTSAKNYEENLDYMTRKVNEIMFQKNQANNLINFNLLSVMYDNHINHGKFMANVFLLNDYKLLENSLEWVISSYISRGFSREYFKVVLDVWTQVISDTLDIDSFNEINKVYQWIIHFNKDFEIEKALEKNLNIEELFINDLKKEKEDFSKLLLQANHMKAIELIKDLIHDKDSLKTIYTEVIKESMYDIGKLWEVGKISVAQEHLATSIVSRIIASIYMDYLILAENIKGKALITAANNEFHELGARMIADLLELDGWDVFYLGANTPNEEVINMLLTEKPYFLAISVTMAFNINNVTDLIKQIKSYEELRYLKILVGGHAFSYNNESSEKLGADKVCTNVDETINIVNKWWRNTSNDEY